MSFAFKCNFFLISEIFLFTNKEGKQFWIVSDSLQPYGV